MKYVNQTFQSLCCDLILFIVIIRVSRILMIYFLEFLCSWLLCLCEVMDDVCIMCETLTWYQSYGFTRSKYIFMCNMIWILLLELVLIELFFGIFIQKRCHHWVQNDQNNLGDLFFKLCLLKIRLENSSSKTITILRKYFFLEMYVFDSYHF
jgi:hypothetical protein